MEYLTKNHSKYLLQYHIIFVVKYRLKIIDQFPIKDICSQLSINDNYIIKVMEVDKDHIHLLVQAEPKISPLYIVKKLKGKSTIILWKNYSQILTRYFWKEHTFGLMVILYLLSAMFQSRHYRNILMSKVKSEPLNKFSGFNFLYKTPDPIASSIELSRRSLYDFYPKLNLSGLFLRWKDVVLKDKFDSWKKLYDFIVKKSKLKYRFPFEETKFSKVFSLRNINSNITLYSFI